MGASNVQRAFTVPAEIFHEGIQALDISASLPIKRAKCRQVLPCFGFLKVEPGGVVSLSFGSGGDRGARTNREGIKQLSGTGEYSLCEWNLSQMAKSLGKDEDAKRFAARSQGYRHFFNPKTGWFEGVCTESNPGQQVWFVPHDVPGLIELAGGKEKFVARLTDFFEKTPDVSKWNDFYNQSNEPVHLIPFLFNRAGAPWLTQKWVPFICRQAYGCDTYGMPGDEDVGQMSAWLVLSASGLHQACPGNTRYEIFTPLFDKVAIRIDPMYGKDKTFTITSTGNGPGERYIQSAKLNGKPFNRCWLDHKEIVAGGTLELELGTEPNKSWGLE